MARGCRSERGQASLEWLAVVALVATLLSLGAALAEAGFLGRRVTRGMARAICVVSSGDCWRDREPCALRTAEHRGGVAVQLAVVKLGGGQIAVLEQRSDGTVAVTRGTSALLGIQAGAGLSRGLALAGLDVSAAAALTAAYDATAEQARTWVVASRADADRLIAGLRPHQLAGGGRAPAPPMQPGSAPLPDVTYRQLGTEATLDATLGAAVGADQVTLAAGALRFDRLAGTRVDHRTGHRTIYVRAASNASLDVDGVLGLRRAGGGETYAVELDAAGRPLDLQVTATGAFAGSADLPDVVQPVAGLLAAGAPDGRVFQVVAHLDLTDAANLAAARGLLDAMHPHVGAPAAATAALRRRLDARGTVEARVLAEAREAADHHVQVPVGPALGASWGHADVTTQLLAATSRGLDGRWITRTDCVSA